MAAKKRREAAASMAKTPTRTEAAAPAPVKTEESAAFVPEKPAQPVDPLAGTVENETAKFFAGTVTTAQAAEDARVIPQVFVQYMGKDVSAEETVKAVHEVWTEEMGHKVEEITDLKLYFRTEINRCYFLINGEVSGSVAI